MRTRAIVEAENVRLAAENRRLRLHNERLVAENAALRALAQPDKEESVRQAMKKVKT